MASRIGDIIIDCTDPERLAAFWRDVLGYRVFARDDTGVAIRGATISPDILFIRVDEPKTTKNRLHLDVCPPIVSRTRNSIDYSASAPPARASWPAAPWVALEDPEGNEFCLMSKRIPAEPAPFHDA